MVVISEIRENMGSPETSGVDVVKGQTELENSSEDDNNIQEKDEIFVINLMENEDDITDEDDDSDDSENGNEETLDDDNDADDGIANESKELFDNDDDEDGSEDDDDGSRVNEDVEDDLREGNDDGSEYSSNEEGEIEHIQEGKDEKESQMDIVKNVMQKAAREAENNAAIVVSKHLDLEYDLGTLLALDTNELDLNSLRNSTEDYLKNLARDNTQLLINHIWELPITRKESEIVVKLPKPTIKIPREKPVPKQKPLTKWEEFAKEKGIRKEKKSKKKWDETLQKWIPRWGYKRAQALKEKNWVVETKKNDDPMLDPFEKMSNEKKERVAKNELQRLRNLAKGSNIKIPRGDKLKIGGSDLEGNGRKKRKHEKFPDVGFLTSDKMNSTELKKALTISKISTASLGKFQQSLPREKEAKAISKIMPVAKERRAPYANGKQEREANLNILDGLLNKRPKLDVEKAVNRHINDEERRRAQENSEKPKGKGKGKRRGGAGEGGKKNNRKGGGNKKSFKGGQGKMKAGNRSITGTPKRKGGKRR